MYFSGKAKKICVCAFTFALAAALCGCGERVDFEDKAVPVEKTSAKLVIQAGETEKLDELTNLESVDLSGSECYEEIIAWAEAHPEVDVTYTVTLPDGTVADNRTESLALGSINSGDAAETARLLSYLPALKALDLSASGLSPADVYEFASALDEVKLTYGFTLFGESYDYYVSSLDLMRLDAGGLEEALSVLPYLPALQTVTLGDENSSSLGWEDIARLVTACPNTDFEYSFMLYGKSFTLLDSEMDLNHISIDDEGALVGQVTECMKNLEYLDMDFCGVSNEAMAALRDMLPYTKVVWRVWFGDNYTARTDVTKILASKPSAGGLLHDSDLEVLKYCTDVKYIDIGHNEILTDLSFVEYMPELEVAVFAMNNFTDLTPLASCKKLEYLEIQTNNNLADISPLGELTELEHLNIAHCRNISDITPLYNLTKLKRLWLGSGNQVPQEQIDEFKRLMPNCEVNTTVYDDPTSEHWRVDYYDANTYRYYYVERYELLMEQFGYLEGDYSLPGNDPKYYAAD